MDACAASVVIVTSRRASLTDESGRPPRADRRKPVRSAHPCSPSAAMTIRLGLFDDHDIVRAGFKHILEAHPDVQIVAEGGTAREALDAARGTPMDVLLCDLSLPDLSGIDVLRQVRGGHPELAVLILSAYSEEQYGLNVLKAGASGFLSKELAPEQLVAAVRTVAAGRRYVSRSSRNCSPAV